MILRPAQMVRIIIVTATLWIAGFAAAQVEVTRFETAQQDALYAELIAELRCLVCANQSLSDSNADLAKDLRGKVRDRVRDGQSRAEIVDYLVSRYGEYVLYRPRFSAANLFLWLAPFVVALAGLGVVIVMVARRSKHGAPYSTEQLKKARALLEDEGV